MNENFEQVLCLMRNGIQGEVPVNGVQYNQAMPGVPTLTDLEIAEIATYIYNAWDNERGLIDVKEAERILNTCAVE
jgi:mono/diheme cytochrome c family protein